MQTKAPLFISVFTTLAKVKCFIHFNNRWWLAEMFFFCCYWIIPALLQCKLNIFWVVNCFCNIFHIMLSKRRKWFLHFLILFNCCIWFWTEVIVFASKSKLAVLFNTGEFIDGSTYCFVFFFVSPDFLLKSNLFF